MQVHRSLVINFMDMETAGGVDGWKFDGNK